MDTVCSNCGTHNDPGAAFCSSCRSYLGWQEQDAASAEIPDAPPRQETEQRHEPPEPSQDGGFRVRIDDLDATVPLDGTPVRISVGISNTSTIVDGYVVEAVNAPTWLEVLAAQVELLPGAEASVDAQLRVQSRRLVPAQSVRVAIRVRNTTGSLAVRDFPVQVVVPALEVPVVLRAEPSLVRVGDLITGVCTIVVDNSRGNTWVQVRMSANDPEDVVAVTWSPPTVQVPPGGEARTEARLAAPPPRPGGEVSRAITVTAKGHHMTAMTTVTLVQVAPRASMELLELRLEPTVLRLGGARRGRLEATADNRRGAQQVDLRLSGADTEDLLGFSFHPATLHVGPGQQASAHVTVTAPRTPPGNEVTHAMTIVASDGRNDVRADGSVIQLSSSHRELARMVLTVLGALALFLSAWLLFFATSDMRAVDLTVGEIARVLAAERLVDPLDTGRVPLGLASIVSVGLGLMVLGGLVLLGLTGRSGRLTRYAAVLAAVVVVATLVGWAAVGEATGPGAGALVALFGCGLGYAGGILAPR